MDTHFADHLKAFLQVIPLFGRGFGGRQVIIRRLDRKTQMNKIDVQDSLSQCKNLIRVRKRRIQKVRALPPAQALSCNRSALSEFSESS